MDYVSVFVGKADAESLEAYLACNYDAAEKTAFASQFLRDFGIDPDDFDEDFCESFTVDARCQTLAELLAGVSYGESFVQALSDSVPLNDGENAAVLLYDYRYEPAETVHSPLLRFAAAVPYEKG